MSDDADYITIGKIVNTQGHRGEVRVIPLTDFPERFQKMKEVYLSHEGNLEKRRIERTYTHKRFVVLKLAGVDDMSASEALKNSLLVVPRNELMPLPENSYYIFDLIGLEVFTKDGRLLGRVRDVLQTGANDVYMVDRAPGPPLLVPALKQVVLEIDPATRKMVVELPEGLEEI